MANRYQFIEKLGEGGMGTVYRALDRLTHEEVALKQVVLSVDQLQFSRSRQGHDSQTALAEEFRTLARLRHPNIISVLDYGFDMAQQPYFTMELLIGAKSIVETARHVSLTGKVQMLSELLLALDYLHHQGIIHHDLKPDNVLITQDNTVKVLDFGLAQKESKFFTSYESDDVIGTMAYMAPELFSGEQGSVQSDLYAFGIIAYEVLYGKYPFHLDHAMILLSDILATDPTIPNFNPALADLIRHLLAKAPDERPTSANAVLNRLYHATGHPPMTESAQICESDREETFTEKHVNSWLIGGESGVVKNTPLLYRC